MIFDRAKILFFFETIFSIFAVVNFFKQERIKSVMQMKNTNAKVMLVTLLFMAVQCVWAQTYLTDTYKPSESQHYKAYPTTVDDVMLIAV